MNPYDPPLTSGAITAGPSRWRIIPATLSSLLGIASTLLGLAIFGETLSITSRQSVDGAALQGFLATTIFLALGAASIYAARIYWHRRYSVAFAWNIGSLVACAVAIAFLG